MFTLIISASLVSFLPQVIGFSPLVISVLPRSPTISQASSLEAVKIMVQKKINEQLEREAKARVLLFLLYFYTTLPVVQKASVTNNIHIIFIHLQLLLFSGQSPEPIRETLDTKHLLRDQVHYITCTHIHT